MAWRARAAWQWLRGPGGCSAVLGCLFGALYWLTATRDFTFDAVSYALQVQRFQDTGEWRWLFHPHHLLFNGVGWLAYRVASSLHPGVDPLSALQGMNAVVGALGVGVFAYAAGRVAGDHGAGLFAGAGLGLSYGYWTCATDGRVNLPGVAVLAGVVLVVAILQDPRRVRAPGRLVRWSAVLGAAHGTAVLWHQSHLLFGPAALAAIGFSPGRPRRAAAAAYLAAGTAVVLAAYAVAALLALGNPEPGGLRNWVFSYLRQGWWWNFEVARNLGKDVTAFGHALLAAPRPATGVYVAALAALLTVAGVGVFRLAAVCRASLFPPAGAGPPVAHADPLPPVRRTVTRDAQRRLAPVLGAWAAAYALFFTFWNPGYFVFWVPLLLPFWLVVACGLGGVRPSFARRTACWAPALLALGLMALSNTVTAVAPHAHRARNMRLQKALAAEPYLRATDRLVVAGTGDDADAEVYVPYFTRGGVISVNAVMARAGRGPAGWNALAAEIDDTLARGGRVFVHEELISSEGPYSALRKRSGVERADVVRFFRQRYVLGRPQKWRRTVDDG